MLRLVLTSEQNRKVHAPLLAFLIYTSLSIFYFNPFAHNFKQTIFMPGGDPEAYIWFLNWWPYAISHGLNPFITHKVWSPSGFNLTWAASIPTLALLTAPITATLGPIFSWNLLSLLAAPLNSFSAFLLLRYLYKDTPSALLGGYLFGYSSYVMGQLLGHLNLDFVCLIPIAILLFILHARSEINKYYFIVLMALTIFLEAGVSTEILATSTLFGFISIAVFYLFNKHLRRRLLTTTIYLAVGYVIACASLSPFIYFLIIGLPDVPHTINSPIYFSSDLLNYIISTPITSIGRSVFSSISSRYTGNYSEEGAYISLPLLLIAAFSLRDQLKEDKRYGLSVFIMLALLILFSFGPFLHVNGVITNVPMPWTIFTHIPLISGALPTRFTNYVSLTLAIIISGWISKKVTRTRFIAVLASIAFIMPNTSIYSWGGQHIPSIFNKEFIRNSNVIVLPFGYTGPSMFWQAESGMTFNMVGGYVGFSPLPFRKMQVTPDLYSGSPSESFHDLFKAYCAQFNVNYVIVCNGTPKLLEKGVQNEGWKFQKIGECVAYSVPKDMQYFSYSGDTWGNYQKFGWIGKNVTIKTNGIPIKIYLTGKYTPNGAPPVSVVVYSGNGNQVIKKFVPGKKYICVLKSKRNQIIKIHTINTWVPNIIIHNGDTRMLSVSMKIKKIDEDSRKNQQIDASKYTR